MNEKYVQHVITILTSQRDNAMNQCVQLEASLKTLQEELEEIRQKNKSEE
jgi:hypothetical protein